MFEEQSLEILYKDHNDFNKNTHKNTSYKQLSRDLKKDCYGVRKDVEYIVLSGWLAVCLWQRPKCLQGSLHEKQELEKGDGRTKLQYGCTGERSG